MSEEYSNDRMDAEIAYQRALYDAEFAAYKRRMDRDCLLESRPLKIEPIPLTLIGYIDHKMADPLWFYGAILSISVITGSIVAWFIGAPQ